MSWMVFVAGAVLSWGLYGPWLHKGQVALGSPLRAFLCVGAAYFFAAVLVPAASLASQGQLRGWNGVGVTSATIAGVLGAAGALCVIYSFRAGGAPLWVMPLVFAGAPIVNVLYTMWQHPRRRRRARCSIWGSSSPRPGRTWSSTTSRRPDGRPGRRRERRVASWPWRAAMALRASVPSGGPRLPQGRAEADDEARGHGGRLACHRCLCGDRQPQRIAVAGAHAHRFVTRTGSSSTSAASPTPRAACARLPSTYSGSPGSPGRSAAACRAASTWGGCSGRRTASSTGYPDHLVEVAMD
jgi:hypothetical protein